MRKLVAFVLFLGLGLFVVACGDDGDSDQAEEPRTVTVEKTVKESPPAEKPAAEEPLPEEDLGGGGKITVPDVVGHDHQLAQDELQDAGLYVLDERDCTGQDRLLLWDRNWTVVKQDPPPGTKVSEDTTITLCSKKDNE